MSQGWGAPDELDAVLDFLTSQGDGGPTALLVEGEPGIGKTTLWLAAVREARRRGFEVMSARPAASESVLAYSALADLLAGVDVAAGVNLPGPQRSALDRVLLRADGDFEATNPRAVAAAYLSVVEQVADDKPLLIAVDDLQWLDMSSAAALAFAARRLSAPVKILGTARTDSRDATAVPWLQLATPTATHRLSMGPLSMGGLHTVLRDRLGRSFPRPVMSRIHEVSGGNPFYALELARTIAPGSTRADVALSSTLADVVRARIDRLAPNVTNALLTAACLAVPTVQLIAAASETDVDHVVELLEEAETDGIVGLDGHLVRFAHPLLAHGVYTEAPAAQRRLTHRRLAAVLDEPELRARHLALAATDADPETVQSLDAAAETARLRGAPAAAAELLDLAIGLGGDTPARRIKAAEHHLGAGDPRQARHLLEQVIATLAPGTLRGTALVLLAIVQVFDDSFAEAAELLEQALDELGESPALTVQAMITLTFALLNSGRFEAANARAEECVQNASRSAQPQLLSQALGMRVMVRFMVGDGVDERGLRRAVDLVAGDDANIAIAFRPSTLEALILAWTGQLDAAHTAIKSIRRACVERGEEHELSFVSFHDIFIDIWRGDFAAAALNGEDTMERAVQLGSETPLMVALTSRALLGAYAGRVEQARLDAEAAIAAGQRCGARTLTEWPVTALGFLEVSLGNHRAALEALQSQVARLDAAPEGTEILAASFVPDAVEAMIHLKRFDEAQPLIERLERNGRRLDRPWMLAVGARCRAMLCAALGDFHAARIAVEQAMDEHRRLPMPFERARTQLLLGELQRRHGQHLEASETLREALATFTDLNTPLWAQRARRDYSGASVDAQPLAVLTPGELRVAKLASTGLTNRSVASALFISPKTVEANLVRVYRKLGIRSRAELGRRMGQLEMHAET